MAKQYEVCGAYVAQVPVAGPQGTRCLDFNHGAILPSDVPEAKLKHLLDVGLIREVSGGDAAATPPKSGAPAKSASKGDWVDYAVVQGADRGEAEELTKDELVALYGGE